MQRATGDEDASEPLIKISDKWVNEIGKEEHAGDIPLLTPMMDRLS